MKISSTLLRHLKSVHLQYIEGREYEEETASRAEIERSAAKYRRLLMQELGQDINDAIPVRFDA